MADVKISALTAASTPLTGAEVLPVVQSGVTTKVAVSNLTAGLAGTASININGTVGATTATTGAFTSGTFSTTLGVSGLITRTGAAATDTQAFIVSGTTTGYQYGEFVNTSGRMLLGILGSVQSIFTGTTAYDSFIGSSSATGLSLATNGAMRLRIDSAGAVTIPGTLGVSTGAAVGGATPGAGGLAFPATAVPVADANTLDDYEEGTWTPNQGSGLTVVGAFSSTGTYTKIGRQVTVLGTVSGATSIAVGAAGIITGNMPFTVGANSGVGSATNAGLTASIATLANTTTTDMYACTAIVASSTMRFSATYFI